MLNNNKLSTIGKRRIFFVKIAEISAAVRLFLLSRHLDHSIVFQGVQCAAEQGDKAHPTGINNIRLL